MAAITNGFLKVGGFVRPEVAAARPVFLFFLVGFLLLLTLVKLVLANFSIEMTALSRAAIGALLAAKAVLVLDETPLAIALKRFRPIISIIVKMVFYGAVTLILGAIEKLIEAWRKNHSFALAAHQINQDAKLYRLLAWALGVGIVFALYFIFAEIRERLGGQPLWKILIQPRSRV